MSPKEKAQEKTQKKVEETVDENFKYIVRVANTDIDGNRTALLALTSIKGVGRRAALTILRDMEVDPRMKIGDFSDEEVEALKEELETISELLPTWMLNRRKDYESGEDIHIISTDINMIRMDDINRMKKIRCYRGIRHENGHKVRGQRTKANGRFGLTLGVSKSR